MDSFFPVVSFLAFVSGGCFGWYYHWRSVEQVHGDGHGRDRRGLRAEIPLTE